MSSQEKVLDLIFGRWRSQILSASVKLGVFDALRSGPKAAPRIAQELDLDQVLSYRLRGVLGSLDALASYDSKSDFSITLRLQLESSAGRIAGLVLQEL
jgi:Dimerisation domain